MAFTTNYDELDEQSLKPEGEYECVIKNVFETISKNSKPYISVVCSICDDVKNPCKGTIFHSIQKKKPENITEDDAKVEGYVAWQVMQLSKAAGLPNGKSYECLGDWCADLKGRPVRVVLEHDTYNGRTREKVKWFNISKVPAPIPSEEDMEDLGDDSDVPF